MYLSQNLFKLNFAANKIHRQSFENMYEQVNRIHRGKVEIIDKILLKFSECKVHFFSGAKQTSLNKLEFSALRLPAIAVIPLLLHADTHRDIQIRSHTHTCNRENNSPE